MRGAVSAVAGAALAGVEGGAGAAGADMVAQPQIFTGLHQCQHHLIGRGGGIFVPDIQVGGAIQPDVGIVDDDIADADALLNGTGGADTDKGVSTPGGKVCQRAFRTGAADARGPRAQLYALVGAHCALVPLRGPFLHPVRVARQQHVSRRPLRRGRIYVSQLRGGQSPARLFDLFAHGVIPPYSAALPRFVSSCIIAGGGIFVKLRTERR